LNVNDNLFFFLINRKGALLQINIDKVSILDYNESVIAEQFFNNIK
jgi:hypothetical protein